MSDKQKGKTNLVQDTIWKVFLKNNIFIVIFHKCSNAPPPTSVFNTVSIGILVAARLVDADLVEWGVKVLILVPANWNVVLIHLTKVL